METAYIIFIALGFVAALVSAVFGFGTALLVLAAGAYILPIKETIALATVLFAASTVTKTLLYHKAIDWKTAATMALASLPLSYLGATLMVGLPVGILRQLLGITVLLYLALTRFNLMPTLKIGTGRLILGSMLYGFLSGLLGSGNIVKAVLFREMSFSKEAFVGAMAATSVLSNLAKLTVFSSSGLLYRELIPPSIALAIVAIITAVIGKQLLTRLSIPHFKSGIHLVLAACAVGLLL